MAAVKYEECERNSRSKSDILVEEIYIKKSVLNSSVLEPQSSLQIQEFCNSMRNVVASSCHNCLCITVMKVILLS